jgi:hypothetical protein
MAYKLRARDGHWSEWVWIPPTARIGCCDCGLVHKFQFRVTTKEGKAFRKVANVAIVYRAKRDEPATKNLRKKK